MEEFGPCLRDWDLEAIVRGISTSGAEATSTMDNNPEFSYFFSEQDEVLDSFPEFSETTRVLDDLEELYKPFYPHTSTMVTTNSLPITPSEPHQQVKLASSDQDQKVPAPPKCKKSSSSKKRQNKSVVKQVTTAEGLDDAWAWRKYGQKPIKGSPYPRSYYRCSSSKGCLARKQVERSHLDPAVFLVTYTAEHSHPHPTRRNSLAGTTRKNNSLLPPTTTTTTTSTITTPNLLQQTTMEFKKEAEEDHEHFLDWLDDEINGWNNIPNSDIDKLIGLDCQHFAALDHHHFIPHP